MSTRVQLDTLIPGTGVLRTAGSPDVEITGISYDSRTVVQGHLFVAVRGEHADGHRFIGDAIRNGAVAVMYDEDAVELLPDAVFLRVGDSRTALAHASTNFNKNPSSRLSVIGITGTNGKTTTSYLVKSILERWGCRVGLIGTIQYMIGSSVYPAKHTTPEALEFQRLLHEMEEAGCSHVVSEVSSHALAQRRVDGTAFRAGIFTNLTRDHLDFHATMESYFDAKKRLFTDLLGSDATAVINNDDPYGRRLADALAGNVVTYGLESGADLVAVDVRNSFSGLTFGIASRGRRFDVASPLIGLPNVYNILSAAAAASSLGVPVETIIEGVRTAAAVRGRFETVSAGQRFLAVVDYAHTEDALERLIYTARGLTKGRIIVVFGCGGNRDRGKRPRMAAIATRLADFVIITSDNPRTEDPDAIIREVVTGAARKNYLVERDRAEAIRRAVLMAEENDIVLVAGKGHETYQEIGGRRTEFNDREVLEDAIRSLVNNR